MRTQIEFLILVLALCLTACQQSGSDHMIPDGLYLIVTIDTIATDLSPLSSNEQEIFFSDMFDDFNSESFERIIIDTSQYAPLELKEAPSTEQQTDNKKKLLLTLSDEASEKLKVFTTKHVSEMVTLVVDGEALTKHKIREPLTSGQLQITRCNDNACERLFETLKDNGMN